MINNKFLHYNTEAAFEVDVNSIPYDSIVFIKDTRKIYTHGAFYCCLTSEPVPEKKDPGFRWSSNAYTATINDSNSFPQIINPNNIELTYSSTNENVATIASNGTITLVSAGNTIIKASFEGNDEYTPKQVEYILTVKNKVITCNISVSPTTIYLNEPNTMAGMATCNVTCDKITVYRGDVTLVEQENVNQVNFTERFTLTSLMDLTYSADFEVNGQTITKTVHVHGAERPVTLPIYYGAGRTYDTANLIQSSNTQLTNNSKYTITTTRGDYIFFKVATNQTLNNVVYDDENKTPITMESPVTDGQYKYYKSKYAFSNDTANLIVNYVKTN